MVFVLASGSRLRPNDALPDALLPPTHTDTVIVQCHFKMRASTAPHRKVKEAQSDDAKHIGLTGSSQTHHAAAQQCNGQGKHRCAMCRACLSAALLDVFLCVLPCPAVNRVSRVIIIIWSLFAVACRIEPRDSLQS